MPGRWKTLTAFAVIYIVWGSTFLAIRVGVGEVPPLLFAAMRFLGAGAALYGWTTARGEPQPSARQWGSIAVLAVLIFLCDYGLLFWAEQRVPSGLAAVMLATIPVFMTLSEIIFLRTQTLTLRLAAALLIGLAGVAVLMSHSLHVGGAPVDTRGAMALIIASISFAISAALTLRLPLPSSKVMSSGTQMLLGGAFLTAGALTAGEWNSFHPAAISLRVWLCLLYLIVAGSIVGFTAYIWLLHRESPTRVGTYAYVNPLVAVLIGYWIGGEELDRRTVLGSLCILVSVVVITTTRRRAAAPKLQTEAKSAL